MPKTTLQAFTKQLDRACVRTGQVNLYGTVAVLDILLADRVISQTKCRKLLAGDGITTSEFTINAFPAIFEGLSIDARVAKRSLPSFGDAFSIAKNLDEYQYKICVFVPSLEDSPAKILLQKYRIAIAAAFVKLVSVIKEDQGSLQGWMEHAHSLLVKTSDAYVAATTRTLDVKKPKLGEALAFFGLPEGDVDRALASAYEQ